MEVSWLCKGEAGGAFALLALAVHRRVLVELSAVLRYERVREMHKRSDPEIDDLALLRKVRQQQEGEGKE